jgi:sec-independent protein translocase protein TatA
MGLSAMHMLLIIIILLVFFGPSRLPSLGKSMGEAIRGFKKGLEGDEIDVTRTQQPPQQQPQYPPQQPQYQQPYQQAQQVPPQPQMNAAPQGDAFAQQAQGQPVQNQTKQS